MSYQRLSWLLFATLSVGSCGLSDSVKTSKSLPVVADSNLLLEVVSGDGQSQRIGRILTAPLTVRARDDAGKPGVGQPVQFEIVMGDATLLGDDVVLTDGDGLASISVQLGLQMNPISISARLPEITLSGRQRLVTFSAVAVPIPPPTLFIQDPLSNGQRGIVNTNLPLHLSVVARDADGNGVSGQTIRYTVVTGSPSVKITPEVTTAADGTASSGLYLGTVTGEIEVRATWLPDPDNDPNRIVTFHATAQPDEPAALSFVSGHKEGDKPSCAGETEEFSAPLVMRLVDQFGNRVAGQNIKIQPGPDLSVVGSGIGVPVLMLTDEEGELSFRLSAATVSGSGYSRTTSVTATTILAGGTSGPSAMAPLNYTKHRYLEVGNESSVWNYGLSGVWVPPGFIFLMYLDYPVEVWARAKCWAPLPGVSITGSYVNKYSFLDNFCPSESSDWPVPETALTSVVADENGHFTGLMRAAVYTLKMTWVATRVQFTAHPAEGDTNVVYFYSGPPDCQ